MNLRNRLRALRVARHRRRLDDDALIAWAAGLIGRTA